MTKEINLTCHHGLEPGDQVNLHGHIGFEDPHGYVITKVNGTTLTLRRLRWYEKLWRKIKHLCRRHT